MTNLRVFEVSENDVLIEVSSPHLQWSRALFVAASFRPADFEELHRGEVLQIRFHDEDLFVYFLDVSSRPRAEVYHDLKLIGALQETDSINILNNILDILAYP